MIQDADQAVGLQGAGLQGGRDPSDLRRAPE